MASISDVLTTVQTVAAAFTAATVRWPNEEAELPGEPAAFVLVEVLPGKPLLAAFGNGRGGNLWRAEGEILGHVFVPRGTGQAVGLAHAETFAALFRGYRDSVISCFAAGVQPGEAGERDGNYTRAATAVIDFHFDQLG